MSSEVGETFGVGSRVRRGEINFTWLIRLRWTAFVGHALTVVVAQWGLGIDLPWEMLLAIIGVEVASNVIASRLAENGHIDGRTSETAIGAVMAIDLLFLTALLYCAGGPSNPFSVFYIINISLAAAVLPSRWAWAQTILAVACFGFLFWRHLPVPELSHHAAQHGAAQHSEPHHDVVSGAGGETQVDSMSLHLRGMLLAFAGAAGFVAYFVTRTRRELERLEDDLAEAERRHSQAEKLESLVTLAAGAAHELATPLSTVLVVAREIERELAGRAADAELLADVRIIHREVARCREILDSLTAQAGESIGESWTAAPVGDLLEETRRGVRHPERIEVEVAPELAAQPLFVPRRAIVQSLQALLQNALDASPDERTVRLRAGTCADGIELTIVDRGRGMSEATRKRVGEPFFTSRAVGRGMGLGVFVARRVLGQLNGRLEYESRLGEGTTARVLLPLSAPPASSATSRFSPAARASAPGDSDLRRGAPEEVIAP